MLIILTKKIKSSNPIASYSNSTIQFQPNPIAKLDSGATNHYFKTIHLSFLKEVTIVQQCLEIHLPNSTILRTSHKEHVQLHSSLPSDATKTYILPKLNYESLLSVGQFCDQDCTVIFHTQNWQFVHGNQTIITGLRNKHDGLWDIDQNRNMIDKKFEGHSLNYIIKNDKPKL